MLRLGLVAIACISIVSGANASITIPGANGSDGALTVASGTTTIDQSLAPSGQWDGTSPTAGKGIYDGSKWAVVYHYSSVNIAAAATVVFKNNNSRAPVVWLVSGDVNIAGTVDLTGGTNNTANTTSNPQSEPGPGGFGGGRANIATGAFAGTNGPGWGLGGGQEGVNSGGYNGPGLYGTSPGAAYGTAQVIPLIGGSGAGGTNNAGGAGGGAILIAATGTITVGGTVKANGGTGANIGGSGFSASGSGGAIRLVADTIAGAGTLNALGGTVGPAAPGRIRIEGNSISSGIVTNPLPSSVHPSNPPLIFPDTTAPSATILSVGGLGVPADPQGRLNAAADVLPDILPATVAVVIQTRNVAVTGAVNLHIAPLSGDASTVAASFTSGNATLATWTANVALPPGSVALQARVEP